MDVLLVLVNTVHVLVIAFFFLGLFFARDIYWFRIIHSAISVGMISFFVWLGGCPLTILVMAITSRNDKAVEGDIFFQKGFVVYYLERWFGFSPPDLILTVTMYLIVMSSLALLGSWLYHSRRKKMEAG